VDFQCSLELGEEMNSRSNDYLEGGAGTCSRKTARVFVRVRAGSLAIQVLLIGCILTCLDL
jgi:hypothetical protein